MANTLESRMMQAADEQAQSPSAGAVSIRKARPGDIPRMQEIFAILSFAALCTKKS